MQVTNQKLSLSSRFPNTFPLDNITTDPNILLAAQYMNSKFGNLGSNAVGVLAAMSDFINTSYGYEMLASVLESTARFYSALRSLKIFDFFLFSSIRSDSGTEPSSTDLLHLQRRIPVDRCFQELIHQQPMSSQLPRLRAMDPGGVVCHASGTTRSRRPYTHLYV